MYRQVLLSDGTKAGKEHGIPIEPDNPNLDDPMIVKFSDGTQVAARCLTVKQYRELNGCIDELNWQVYYVDHGGNPIILHLEEQTFPTGPSSEIWMIKHFNGSPNPQVLAMTKNPLWNKRIAKKVQAFMEDITQQYWEGLVDKDGAKAAKTEIMTKRNLPPAKGSVKTSNDRMSVALKAKAAAKPEHIAIQVARRAHYSGTSKAEPSQKKPRMHGSVTGEFQ